MKREISVVGILGGGQLGRMLAMAARPLGLRVHVYSPDASPPAAGVADRVWTGAYNDEARLAEFGASVDAVTFEFENVPVEAGRTLAEATRVRPAPEALAICQDRLAEKNFLSDRGFAVAPFRPVATESELEAALDGLGCPAVLKTARMGYDGKGQVKLSSSGQSKAAWDAVGGQLCVLESFVDFEKELSVIVARGADGATAGYPVFENAHCERHILDVSVAPAAVSEEAAARARRLAVEVAEALDMIGVLTVELFFGRDGELIINELAPRVHNSGHLTIEGAVTSQFEQQMRAVAGFPLGAPDLPRPAAMANLLGDLWNGRNPDWDAALRSDPALKLHLYGKESARPARKMGHLTAVDESREEASRRVLAARDLLTRG